MSVGVMKDYKLKQRNLRASHTLGWSWIRLKPFSPGSPKKWEFRTFDKFSPSLRKQKKRGSLWSKGINPVEGCEGRLS